MNREKSRRLSGKLHRFVRRCSLRKSRSAARSLDRGESAGQGVFFRRHVSKYQETPSRPTVARERGASTNLADCLSEVGLSIVSFTSLTNDL